MEAQQFAQVASALTSTSSRRRALKLFGAVLIGPSLGLLGLDDSFAKDARKQRRGEKKNRHPEAGSVDAQATCTNVCNCTSCNCVYYVRCQTGISGGPSTAAGYRESVMRGKGYVRVKPTAGAIIVWDANQKGATSDGHMGIVRSARYNTTTKKWEITVTHSNWGGCGVRTSPPFKWGDLYGVNFYVRK